MQEIDARIKQLSIVVGSIVLLLLGIGAAGILPIRAALSAESDTTAVVSSGITYQGRLTNPDGEPLDGTYPMRFVVYNAATAGTALWDSGPIDVAVADGLFTLKLGVNRDDFDGQALWLSIEVDDQVLSPRQEILPVPYALSLRPGADIFAGALAASDAAVAAYAPATGAAMYGAAAGGAGIYGASTAGYGVRGISTDSWGGYFSSTGGYGLRVETAGAAHYDHGAYITSAGGYGVYAQSAGNQGVRAEAGDVSGIAEPLGAVGVVGIGANRGTYGASQSGVGVYGSSAANYGIWGQSTDYRGVTGRTSRSDSNYGLYTPDNLYAANATVAGSFMQVMQNGGTEPLAPGDVVVFSGVTPAATADGSPLAQVSAAGEANHTGVAGVVYSRFNLDAVNPDLEVPDGQAGDVINALAGMEVTPAGRAAPGEYVLVVVQGLAQVRAGAVETGDIAPGDLLATGSTPGTAAKAATVSISGVETTTPGTVFAKALEPLDAAAPAEMIYVYVTLQ